MSENRRNTDSTTSAEGKARRLGEMLAPRAVGEYSLVRFIGGGGMGDVWLATDNAGNEVAVKLLSVSRLGQEDAVNRFIREGQTLSRLQHRNICRIHGIEEAEGRHYLVMEYVQGVNLSKLLHYLNSPTVSGSGTTTPPTDTELSTIIDEIEQVDEPDTDWPEEPSASSQAEGRTLPLQQTLAIVMKICEAVQYAHERGVFHRDIKPSNVIVRRDGEPVLLDFGVAKIAGEIGLDQLTLPGQLFGTLEYMAPEQARSAGDVDERADVYSLGAILYEMTTGHRHFSASGSNVRDARRLADHVPVKPRVHSRQVDAELQDIIMKALHPDPVIRYRSARQLHEDLRRYREGEPVTARPPSWQYRLSKFVRRNALALALGSVAAVLTVGLLAHATIDHVRQWRNWKVVLEEDFRDGTYDRTQFSFVTENGTEGEPWVADESGLHMTSTHWCWLNGIEVAGDVRVEMRFHYVGEPDGLEITVNTAAGDSLERWWHLPRGYSGQIGGYNGTVDLVSVNKKPRRARLTNSAPSIMDVGRDVTVRFERRGNTIALWVNGRKHIDVDDLTPIWGTEFSGIGFRTYARDVVVRDLSVYHLALPQSADPLIVADALTSLGFYRDAVQSYLTVLHDFGKGRYAERALVGAALAAYEVDGPDGEALVDSIHGILEGLDASSPAWQSIRERQMLKLWEGGGYEKVLKVLPDHFRYYPRTRIALELPIEEAEGLTLEQREKVFAWSARTQGVVALDATGMPARVLNTVQSSTVRNVACRGCGLGDLAMLSGLQLRWLDCGENRVPSLVPLAGQPLEYLVCDNNRLRSLDGIQGGQLRWLNCASNDISDLGPLRGMQLKELNMMLNDVEDLEPLRGMRLEQLIIGRNRLSDLGPLAGMPLTRLVLDYNQVTDLSPLDGMPLEWLSLEHNQGIDLGSVNLPNLTAIDLGRTGIDDLSPLKGLDLKYVSLWDCPVEDLSPILQDSLKWLMVRGMGLTSLEMLRGLKLSTLDMIDNRVTSLAPLEGMPLRDLDCRGNPLRTLEPFTDNPPAVMQFMDTDLPDRELRRMLAKWRGRPELASHRHQARVMIALRKDDPAALRRLAKPHDGHEYLLVPAQTTWTTADSMARAWGGHLLTLADLDEERHARSLKATRVPVWVGARTVGGVITVVNGESSEYLSTIAKSESNGEWTLREDVVTWPSGAECAFIVEWEPHSR